MKDDPRDYEPQVHTARFRDFRGEFTPLPYPGMTEQLTKDQERLVDTVIAMYAGTIAEHLNDFKVLYSTSVIFDDGLAYIQTRRRIAAHFYALPECFAKVEVLAHQTCFCAADVICIKIHTAYTEPSVGTKTFKHLVSLGLDHNSETPLVRYHKDELSPKNYSDEGLIYIMEKVNSEPEHIMQKLEELL